MFGRLAIFIDVRMLHVPVKDIIDKNDRYAVLRKCPAECAGLLRISEKTFVADHAQSLEQQIRFRSLFAGWFSRRVGQASKISGIRNDWHVLHWLIWAADPRLLQIQCLMQLYGPVLVGQAQTWHSADSRDATGSLFWEGNKPFVRRNVNFLGWNKCLWMTEKV